MKEPVAWRAPNWSHTPDDYVYRDFDDPVLGAEGKVSANNEPLYLQPEITVEIREVYGAKKYYPHCGDAKVFASIAGTTTLTEQTLRRVMKLGYKVKTLQRPTELTEGEL